MVLDLRLTMEIGCRDDNLFRFIDPHKFSQEKVTSVFTKHHDGKIHKKRMLNPHNIRNFSIKKSCIKIKYSYLWLGR